MSEYKELDAVTAASETHKVLFENDKMRLLEVKIQPGQKEPLHSHPYKSLTIVQTPSQIKYFDTDGNLIDEETIEGVSWLEPMGPHSTENVGDREFHGYRVELK